MTDKLKQLLADHGPESIACYNTGQLCMEEFYTLGKLMRAGFRTPNLDGNTRTCMASAVVGHTRAPSAPTAPSGRTQTSRRPRSSSSRAPTWPSATRFSSAGW